MFYLHVKFDDFRGYYKSLLFIVFETTEKIDGRSQTRQMYERRSNSRWRLIRNEWKKQHNVSNPINEMKAGRWRWQIFINCSFVWGKLSQYEILSVDPKLFVFTSKQAGLIVPFFNILYYGIASLRVQ